MTSRPNIQILLATYNGARYLEGFLESLVSQSYRDWHLLVRDDGSTDETQAILKKWETWLGERMQVLPDSGQANLGVGGNFSRLLAASSAPYVMFADQDDVWNDDKIDVTLNAMLEPEAKAGKTTPCLVHTDLTLVDGRLQLIAASFWRYQGLQPHRGHAFSRILVENTITACTAMINRSLVDMCGEVPAELRYLDWWGRWIALVATAFGRIVSLPVQTLLWRRHGSNETDTIELTSAARTALMSPVATRRRLIGLLESNRPQAEVFLRRYRDRLDEKQVAALKAFLELPQKGFLARRWAVLRHRLLFTSSTRSMGLLLLL